MQTKVKEMTSSITAAPARCTVGGNHIVGKQCFKQLVKKCDQAPIIPARNDFIFILPGDSIVKFPYELSYFSREIVVFSYFILVRKISEKTLTR